MFRFSNLLQNQFTCRVIAACAATHLGLVSLGLPGWPCPIRHVLGIPCPGCGITRALVAMAKGDWQKAIEIHAFTPFVALGIGLVLMVAILPKPQSSKFTSAFAKFDEHSNFSLLIVVGMLVYWLIRLIFFNSVLFRLVM